VPSDETTKLLWGWGLRIDHELRTIICWTCGSGVGSQPSKIMSHLQSRHSRKGHTVARRYPELLQSLEKGLRGFKFSNSRTVKDQPADRAPVAGVKIHRGFYCPLLQTTDGKACLATFVKPQSVYEHCKRWHSKDKDRLKPTQVLDYPCDCQTIFKGNEKKYFRVKAGLLDNVPEDSENPYSVIVRDMAAFIPRDLSATEELKREELPSLLRATEWHLFIEKYRRNPKDVTDLIRLPAGLDRGKIGPEAEVDKGLTMLLEVSEDWVANARGYWEHCTPIMRQILDGYPV